MLYRVNCVLGSEKLVSILCCLVLKMERMKKLDIRILETERRIYVGNWATRTKSALP